MTRMSDNPDAPLLTPQTPDRVLAQTEIMVLRQISDNLTRLNSRVDDIHDRVLRLDAQEAISKIGEEKRERMDGHDRLEKILELNSARLHALELSEARYRGLFLPLAVLLSGMVAAFGSAIVQNLIRIGGH